MRHYLTSQQMLNEYVAHVARALGPLYRSEPRADLNAVRIVDGDGQALDVLLPAPSRADWLRVYAVLPDDSTVAAPQIGTSALRPEHVAKQITQRLLPAFAEAVEQYIEDATARRAEEVGREAAAAQLAELLPGARILREWPRPKHTTVLFKGMVGDRAPIAVSLEVRASGNWVAIEAETTPAEVLAALKALTAVPSGRAVP